MQCNRTCLRLKYMPKTINRMSWSTCIAEFLLPMQFRWNGICVLDCLCTRNDWTLSIYSKFRRTTWDRDEDEDGECEWRCPRYWQHPKNLTTAYHKCDYYLTKNRKCRFLYCYFNVGHGAWAWKINIKAPEYGLLLYFVHRIFSREYKLSKWRRNTQL